MEYCQCILVSLCVMMFAVQGVICSKNAEQVPNAMSADSPIHQNKRSGYDDNIDTIDEIYYPYNELSQPLDEEMKRGTLFRFGKRGSLLRFGKRSSLFRFGKRGTLFRFGRGGENTWVPKRTLFRYGKRSDAGEAYPEEPTYGNDVAKRVLDSFHWGRQTDE